MVWLTYLHRPHRGKWHFPRCGTYNSAEWWRQCGNNALFRGVGGGFVHQTTESNQKATIFRAFVCVHVLGRHFAHQRHDHTTEHDNFPCCVTPFRGVGNLSAVW